MKYLIFLLYIFAAFRITILFSKDNGPYDVFDWIRYKLGVRTTLDSDGNPELVSERFLGRLIICTGCFSGYVIAFMIPLFLLNIPIINYVVYFFGCWGIVILLLSNYEKS